jgi:tetratricopeptide (TPR) repeat protein
MKFFRYAVLAAVVLSGAGGCGKKEDAKEGERLMARARLLEEAPDSLAQAVALYRQVAGRLTGLPAGQQAGDRAERLAKVEEVYRRTGKTVAGDSAVIRFCQEVLAIAPDYRPAIRRLGGLYHSQIDFVAQLAANPAWHNEGLMKQAWSLWQEQDRLWSRYDFRPQGEDREWGDRLCRSSQVVANMLSKYDRYADALATVERGLSYARTDAEAARAKVYAAYYHFWLRHFEKTVNLAQEALDSGLLEKDEKARAYHAMGLGHTYLYQDSKDMGHLEKAIKSVNESLLIEPQNPPGRELLRSLRDAKEKLTAASSP